MEVKSTNFKLRLKRITMSPLFRTWHCLWRKSLGYHLLHRNLYTKNCPEEESELKKLKDLEKSVEQIANKVEDVNKELLAIQKGFLTKSLQVEALGKLDKRIKTTVEQFMKVLEQIDSMTMPENFSDCKMKRKGLVQKVQGLLAQCDTVEGNISQEMDKLQCKNLALSK
ncbi:BAG family molecular chaperone regulator 1 isoform X3 [Bufo gargarizans]|uniref:BAG family molecular chaperone regulator 1 isoform X3 n=1 Tax=Bufo gargarizans TaxID=30331 RepID=UPI001CF3CA3A|nr:BAG family molecular chaperone regulator 1 isoform X3 [Bufo gargarizans]